MTTNMQHEKDVHGADGVEKTAASRVRMMLAWPAKLIRAVLMGLVYGYRLLISPILPSTCRYYPTCSAYSLEALRTHGALHGAWLSLKRIVRCHPWAEGGVDLVPEKKMPHTSARQLHKTHTHSPNCSHTH